MENYATNPTTITINSHKIRIIKKSTGTWFITADACKALATWFVTADVCHALGYPNTREAISHLKPEERNVIDGHVVNDHNMICSIISLPGLKKLVQISNAPDANKFLESILSQITEGHAAHGCNAELSPAVEPAKDEQISILKNQINVLEELLMDGAGPMKAFPVPARQTEATASINQLEAINRMHPAIVEDTLVYAQNLILDAMGKTHLDALKETMVELSDNHPQAYQQVIRRIDANHSFLFDIGETLSPSSHWVSAK